MNDKDLPCSKQDFTDLIKTGNLINLYFNTI